MNSKYYAEQILQGVIFPDCENRKVLAEKLDCTDLLNMEKIAKKYLEEITEYCKNLSVKTR